MKRHPALRDLSSDHHQSLVQGQRLQKWAQSDTATRQKIVADFLQFWHTEDQRHFCEEEQALLPYFARWGDLTQPPIQQMLREHVLVRRNSKIIEENPTQSEQFYTDAGKLLESHVRLEERQVFPLIEQSLPESALDQLPTAIATWQCKPVNLRQHQHKPAALTQKPSPPPDSLT